MVEESVVKGLVVWLGCDLVDCFSRIGSDVVAKFPCVGVHLDMIHDLFW